MVGALAGIQHLECEVDACSSTRGRCYCYHTKLQSRSWRPRVTLGLEDGPEWSTLLALCGCNTTTHPPTPLDPTLIRTFSGDLLGSAGVSWAAQWAAPLPAVPARISTHVELRPGRSRYGGAWRGRGKLWLSSPVSGIRTSNRWRGRSGHLEIGRPAGSAKSVAPPNLWDSDGQPRPYPIPIAHNVGVFRYL